MQGFSRHPAREPTARDSELFGMPFRLRSNCAIPVREKCCSHGDWDSWSYRLARGVIEASLRVSSQPTIFTACRHDMSKTWSRSQRGRLLRSRGLLELCRRLRLHWYRIRACSGPQSNLQDWTQSSSAESAARAGCSESATKKSRGGTAA